MYLISDEGHNECEEVVDGLVWECKEGEAARVVPNCQLRAHQAQCEPSGHGKPEGGASPGQVGRRWCWWRPTYHCHFFLGGHPWRRAYFAMVNLQEEEMSAISTLQKVYRFRRCTALWAPSAPLLSFFITTDCIQLLCYVEAAVATSVRQSPQFFARVIRCQPLQRAICDCRVASWSRQFARWYLFIIQLQLIKCI